MLARLPPTNTRASLAPSRAFLHAYTRARTRTHAHTCAYVEDARTWMRIGGCLRLRQCAWKVDLARLNPVARRTSLLGAEQGSKLSNGMEGGGGWGSA